MDNISTIEIVKEETSVVEMLKERIEIQPDDVALYTISYDSEDDYEQEDKELIKIEENKLNFDKPTLTLLYLVKDALYREDRKIDIDEDTKKILDFVIISNPRIIDDFEKALDLIYFSPEESLVYKVKKVILNFSYMYSYNYPYKNGKNFIKIPLEDCCGSFFKCLIDVYTYKNVRKLEEPNFHNVHELIDIIVGVSKLNIELEKEDRMNKSRYIKFLKMCNKVKDKLKRMFYTCMR
jgi:hypothetical protein